MVTHAAAQAVKADTAEEFIEVCLGNFSHYAPEHKTIGRSMVQTCAVTPLLRTATL